MSNTATNQQPPNTLIKLPEVKRRTTLSTSEIYRRIAAGTFPKQIRLGAKSVAWLESDIYQWIAEQVEGAK